MSLRPGVLRSMTFCLAAGACGGGDDPPAHTCAVPACRGAGLAVMVISPPTEPYRIEATAAGATGTHTRDCNGVDACDVFFTDFVPTRVTIKVVTPSATASYDAVPAYAGPRSTDPDCPWDCRIASVTVPGSTSTVAVYRYAGSAQCTGGGLTLGQMQAQLANASIQVLVSSCGSDGNGYPAVCGAPDGRIGIFDIPGAQSSAALALGFALLSDLPNAARVGC